VGETETNKEYLISEIAAVEGIATNFACGEFVALDLPWPVNVPADLPYVTGVGGVILALNSDDSIAFQTAWETHASVPIEGGTIRDPAFLPPESAPPCRWNHERNTASSTMQLVTRMGMSSRTLAVVRITALSLLTI
jgi:hypothetical protein